VAFRLVRPGHVWSTVGLEELATFFSLTDRKGREGKGRDNPQPISSESFVSGAMNERRQQPKKKTENITHLFSQASLEPNPTSSAIITLRRGKEGNSANATLKRRGLSLQLSAPRLINLWKRQGRNEEGGKQSKSLRWAQQRRLVLITASASFQRGVTLYPKIVRHCSPSRKVKTPSSLPSRLARRA
jgi:hypothetical protein